MDDVMRWQERNGRHLSAALAGCGGSWDRPAPWTTTRLAAATRFPARRAKRSKPEPTTRPPPWRSLPSDLASTRSSATCSCSPPRRRSTAGFPTLLARVLDNLEQAFPSFSVALTAFPEASWEALAPWGALRRNRLIEVVVEDGQAPGRCPIRADERVVNYLKGLNHLDVRLAPLLGHVEAEDCGAAARVLAGPHGSDRRYPEPAGRRADSRGATDGGRPTGQAGNRPAIGRRARLDLVRLDAALLPAMIVEVEPLARLWNRERRLLPLAVYVDFPEPANFHDHQVPGAVPRTVRGCRLRGDWHCTGPGLGRAGKAIVSFQVPPLMRDDRRRAWAAELGANPVAGSSPSGLRTSSSSTAEPSAGSRRSTPRLDQSEAAWSARLWDMCRAVTRPEAERLAQVGTRSLAGTTSFFPRPRPGCCA